VADLRRCIAKARLKPTRGSFRLWHGGKGGDGGAPLDEAKDADGASPTLRSLGVVDGATLRIVPLPVPVRVLIPAHGSATDLPHGGGGGEVYDGGRRKRPWAERAVTVYVHPDSGTARDVRISLASAHLGFDLGSVDRGSSSSSSSSGGGGGGGGGDSALFWLEDVVDGGRLDDDDLLPSHILSAGARHAAAEANRGGGGNGHEHDGSRGRDGSRNGHNHHHHHHHHHHRRRRHHHAVAGDSTASAGDQAPLLRVGCGSWRLFVEASAVGRTFEVDVPVLGACALVQTNRPSG